MRFYNIVIKDPATGKVITTSGSPNPNTTFSSTTTGGNRGTLITGALEIELDIPLSAYAEPDSEVGATLTVHGVPLNVVQQSPMMFGPTRQFDPLPTLAQYKTIEIYGGFSPGLPLATGMAPHAGLLVEGLIYQAFGNWVGVDQNINFLIRPNTSVPHTFNWKAGTPLSSAIAATLTAAYPKLKQSIAINPNLVVNHDEPGYYGDLASLALMIRDLSRKVINSPTYYGVDITIRNGTISVFDGSTPKNPIPIAFQDLIGQPTWIEPLEIQFMTPLRADINVGDVVQLPPGAVPLIVTTATAVPNAQLSGKNVFIAPLLIKRVHHYGVFRQPDARSWASVFNGYPILPTVGAPTPLLPQA